MEILDGSRNLTQQLTYELGKAIVQGRYQEDSAFPTEAELSAQFNISRSVTREAVKMLTAKGLISSRPRKGIRVQPSNSWNMFDTDVLNWILGVKPSFPLLLEITQLRVAIEPEAAALACLNGSAEQFDAIAAEFERMQMASAGSNDQFEAAVRFSICILEASNNRFYSQFCGFLHAAKRIGQACISQAEIKPTLRLALMREVYESIVSRNPDDARRKMRSFLIEFIADIDALLDIDNPLLNNRSIEAV